LRERERARTVMPARPFSVSTASATDLSDPPWACGYKTVRTRDCQTVGTCGYMPVRTWEYTTECRYKTAQTCEYKTPPGPVGIRQLGPGTTRHSQDHRL
jgi:hypothetical protein